MRWVDIIEVAFLLVPIFIMTVTLTFVYSMCMELGIVILYAKFPPV